jgi:hypothetical protein
MAKVYDFQLKSLHSLRAVRAAGGQALVVSQGGTQKVALQDINGASISNPVALTNGRVTFRTANSVAAVDIYIIAPTGHCVMVLNAVPGDRAEVAYATLDLPSVWVIPFNIADYPAGAETLTGLTLPVDTLVDPNAALMVSVLEATGAKTLSWGINSAETNGSATGFGINVPTAAVGAVPLKSAVTATRGSFIGAGTLDKTYRCDGVAKTISISPVAASTTVAGFLYMPVYVPQALLFS